jgi:N utilization substance protein A
MIGRAIALVNEENLSQAIGRFGQNVRLASKLCSWDIEIMTAPELERQIERAMEAFMQIEGMTEEVAQQLVEQGYLSFDDLSVIEPEALIEMGGYTEDQVNAIVEQAEERAAELEAEEEARKQQEKAEKERRATEALDQLQHEKANPTGGPRSVAAPANAAPANAAPVADVSAADASVANEPAAEAPAENTSAEPKSEPTEGTSEEASN